MKEGGNMKTLQMILGHKSLAMTANLYAHVLPNMKQQEMEQIEVFLLILAIMEGLKSKS